MNIKKLSIILLLMNLKTGINAWIFQPVSDNDTEPFISQPGNRDADAYREYIKNRILLGQTYKNNSCCE